MQPTRVFIHGLESSSRGNKGVFFRGRYPDMILGDFGGPFPQRMKTLEELLAGRDNLILVGSSYGGLMAAVYACLHEERVKKLVLLAPALHLPEFTPHLGRSLRMPVAVFHGIHDAVVPLEAVREIAGKSFPGCSFTTLDDEHPLHRTFEALDWDSLLSPA